jgi:hypothetical protein
VARVVYLDGQPVRDPVAALERVLAQCAVWAADGTKSLYIGGRTYAAEVLLELVADEHCSSRETPECD